MCLYNLHLNGLLRYYQPIGKQCLLPSCELIGGNTRATTSSQGGESEHRIRLLYYPKAEILETCIRRMIGPKKHVMRHLH